VFQLLFTLQKLAIAAPVLAWADFVNVRVSHPISQQISCGDRFGQFRADHCACSRNILSLRFLPTTLAASILPPVLMR
jgi:hypothetical protein